jgi:hypothetical protein
VSRFSGQRHEIVVRALSILLCSAILYVRRSDSFRNPQFFAEDGTIFFAQNLRLGLRAHLESYAGYFCEVPRLIASFAGFFPYRLAPAIYVYSALFVVLLLVIKLHSRRLGLPFAPAFALGFVLVPHLGGEVFLCVTNLQWILALLLLIVAAQPSPRTPGEAVPDWLTAVLASMTGPFAVLLFPVFVLRAYLDRSPLGAVTAGCVGLAATVQTYCILRHPIVLPASLHGRALAWLDLLGQRLVGTLLLGAQLAYRIHPLPLLAAGALLLWFMIRELLHSRAHRWTGLLFLAFGGAVTGLAFLKFRAMPQALLPPGNGTRYFFIVDVVVIWCLLLSACEGRAVQRIVSASILGAILVSSLRSGFRAPPLKDYDWRKYAERIGVDAPLSIPINPPGWTIEILRR